MINVRSFYAEWTDSDNYANESAAENKFYDNLKQKITDIIGNEKYRNNLEEEIVDYSCEVQYAGYVRGFQDCMQFIFGATGRYIK